MSDRWGRLTELDAEELRTLIERIYEEATGDCCACERVRSAYLDADERK